MELITKLEKLLANTYGLYLKTQNYHWNVAGPNFYSLHKMLEEQYQGLAEAVDEIAERIRTIGGYAPGSFAEFKGLLVIDEAVAGTTAEEMIKQLAADHESLIKLAYSALFAAQADNHQEGVGGMLAERISSHEKIKWMLASSI